MNYELQRRSRYCAETGKELTPGDVYYSVLFAKEDGLKRCDYSSEAWHGPPEKAIGWWQAEVPTIQSRKKHWAPNEVMLHFFEEIATQPDKQDMRYVLALLLVRRRVMRFEETEQDDQGNELLVLYCPRRDTTYKIPASEPIPSRVEAIQEELAQLLE